MFICGSSFERIVHMLAYGTVNLCNLLTSILQPSCTPLDVGSWRGRSPKFVLRLGPTRVPGRGCEPESG
jgi:hypothetical protein